MPDPPDPTNTALQDRLWQWAMDIPAMAANIPQRHRLTQALSAPTTTSDLFSISAQPTLHLISTAAQLDAARIAGKTLIRRQWLWQMSASPHEPNALLRSLEAAMLELASSSHTLIDNTHGIRHIETQPITLDPPQPETVGRWILRMPFQTEQLLPHAPPPPPG